LKGAAFRHERNAGGGGESIQEGEVSLIGKKNIHIPVKHEDFPYAIEKQVGGGRGSSRGEKSISFPYLKREPCSMISLVREEG